MAVTFEQIVRALKQWGEPTVTRYREHVKACEQLGVEASTFLAFASDVFGTPEDKRDWLLTVEPIANVEAFTRFRQYESPRLDQIPTGLFYRDYRKGKR